MSLGVHTDFHSTTLQVALSMFVLVPHNLLLLDEPSNHLDVGALDALTAALVEYTGSHTHAHAHTKTHPSDAARPCGVHRYVPVYAVCHRSEGAGERGGEAAADEGGAQRRDASLRCCAACACCVCLLALDKLCRSARDVCASIASSGHGYAICMTGAGCCCSSCSRPPLPAAAQAPWCA